MESIVVNPCGPGREVPTGLNAALRKGDDRAVGVTGTSRTARQVENARGYALHLIKIQRRRQRSRGKQEQLVRKLATLGELAAGVAHELRNPLNSIGLLVGNAIDLVELSLVDGRPADSEMRQALDAMRMSVQQVRKATEILAQLRTLGRAVPVRRDPVNLHAVIEQALALARGQLATRGIGVTLDPALTGALVLGDPTQLEQVFINLLGNAVDALADSRRKAVHISGSVDAEAVHVVFADTGPGIPAGLERRIFEPFFTTKDSGHGTGLGLSITRGIVREHGGTISVVRTPGEGATFLIRLPLAPSVCTEALGHDPARTHR